jgi:2,5-diketo-D-gluconate reductase A
MSEPPRARSGMTDPVPPAIPRRPLNDGRAIPAIGLGTYPLDDDQAAAAVGTALELGYRLIDSAAAYGNEAGVGRAIARSRVPRNDIFVTTKLPGRDHGFDETLASFERSRARLGLDYLDLYLIHWPLPRIDRYVESWRAMLRLRREGLVRSIGVSNFTAAQIDRLAVETGVVPAVNQIELHPHFTQEAMLDYDRAKGIATQSWRPLGRGDLLDDGSITAIAAAHRVSPAQAVLRWQVQRGAIPIPKSVRQARQAANLDVFRFELTDSEMAAIADRDERRLGGDPDTHEEL